MDWLVQFGSFWRMEYAFVARALVVSVTVGMLCGAAGVWMVLRGLSLVGDVAAHATLPGLCIAFLIAGQGHPAALLAGALCSAVLAVGTLAVLEHAGRTRPDAAMALVLSVFFGAGAALLQRATLSPGAAQAGLQSFLLGNAAAVTTAQLWTVVIASVTIAVLMAVGYRWLVLSTFDPVFARLAGVPVAALRMLSVGLLAAAVVVSVQAVGLVMVAAMLVIPASAALLVGRTMPVVLAVATLVGGLSGAVGSWVSFAVPGVATGPAMVLAAAMFFGLSAWRSPAWRGPARGAA
jgi:ABC-type Mn2+/Zn2+ transport system permease subunit